MAERGDAEAAEEILGVLLQLGAGNLDARVTQPDGDGPLDMIAVAVNMFADELAWAKDRELELRAHLERQVAELERNQEQIAAQHQAIRELSTPVLEVGDGVLVLPLVGSVDEARGEQVIDDLLDAIAKEQAHAAIIDVTGLALLDTLVAGQLLRAIAAAQLLGARVIVTGMGSANAQLLVELGVDFGAVETARTLKSGLDVALARARRRRDATRLGPGRR